MVAENSSHVSRADFLKLYDKLRNEPGDRRGRKGDSFEAGRIFERYDKEKNGTMTKKDFVNFFNDMNRSRDFTLLERYPEKRTTVLERWMILRVPRVRCVQRII